MKNYLIISLFFLGLIACDNQYPEVYTVTEYDVVPNDTARVQTAQIQQLIDRAHRLGGGVVRFPAGQYVTGTLVLKTGVTLQLDSGSELLGSLNIADYPDQQVEVDFFGKPWKKKALLFAQNSMNIELSGKGTVNGRGWAFKPVTKKKPDRYFNRPYGIFIVKCKNVRVSGVNLRNSAYWMQHYLQTDSLLIEGVNVFNHVNQNNDGMDIDGCTDVRIAGCTIDSDDDGLCIKSLSFVPSKNVIVENCTISSHCNALKLGTESIGGFENVVARNIVIKPSRDREPIYGSPDGDGGIALQSVDGAILEHVQISGVDIEGTRSPLHIRLGQRNRSPGQELQFPDGQRDLRPPGELKNVLIENVTARASDSLGCFIAGTTDGIIDNVTLRDIEITLPPHNDSHRPDSLHLDYFADHYPEGDMFGYLPNKFFIGNARNVHAENVKVKVGELDFRPLDNLVNP